MTGKVAVNGCQALMDRYPRLSQTRIAPLVNFPLIGYGFRINELPRYMQERTPTQAHTRTHTHSHIGRHVGKQIPTYCGSDLPCSLLTVLIQPVIRCS